MWHYLRDPTFSRFDTIPEFDRHTDTRQRHIPRLARRRAVKTPRKRTYIGNLLTYLLRLTCHQAS